MTTNTKSNLDAQVSQDSAKDVDKCVMIITDLGAVCLIEKSDKGDFMRRVLNVGFTPVKISDDFFFIQTVKEFGRLDINAVKRMIANAMTSFTWSMSASNDQQRELILGESSKYLTEVTSEFVNSLGDQANK